MNQAVAVVGPNGSLGPPVISYLVAAPYVGKVSILTRNGAKAAKAYRSAKCSIVEVRDYEAIDLITPLLRGHDAVVLLLNWNVLGPHLAIMYAAIAAGVPRLIPNCFGLDGRDAVVKAIPALKNKTDMEGYVVRKAEEGKISFTAIQTGMFLEPALKSGLMLNCDDNACGDKTLLIDGGDVRIDLMSLDDIGRAVARVLEIDAEEESVKNKFLFLRSKVVTQNGLLEMAREHAPERRWEVTPVTSEEAEQKVREAYEKGDKTRDLTRWLVMRVSFGFGLVQKTDNDVLGIEEWSDSRMRQVLGKVISSNK